MQDLLLLPLVAMVIIMGLAGLMIMIVLRTIFQGLRLLLTRGYRKFAAMRNTARMERRPGRITKLFDV